VESRGKQIDKKVVFVEARMRTKCASSFTSRARSRTDPRLIPMPSPPFSLHGVREGIAR
jgi:hypothetical protein